MAFGGTVKLTGESEYKKALADITSNLKVLNSEMKVVTSQYDNNDKSAENLTQQNDVLNKKIAEQKEKVDIFIGNHTWNNGTYEKYETLIKNGKNDFLDSTLWPIFLETCKSHLDSVILKETAAQAEANKI